MEGERGSMEGEGGREGGREEEKGSMEVYRGRERERVGMAELYSHC